WAATLLESTVRAALNSVVALAVLAMAAAAGSLLGRRFQGLETRLLVPVMTGLHWAPEHFSALLGSKFMFALLTAPVLMTALIQSLRQFRRAKVRRTVLWKYFAILLALGFCLSFWTVDLVWSLSAGYARTEQEIRLAVMALPTEELGVSRIGSTTVT